MIRVWKIVGIASLMALAACAGRPHQTDSTAPTVTYSYSDDDDYDQVAERADNYCNEQYAKDAVLVDRAADNSDFEATFACK
jgi:hypothetical protein